MATLMITRDKIAQSDIEINRLRELLLSVDKLDGDMAEVGVFHGGTASIMRELSNPSKHLYLYDTYVDDYGGVMDYFGGMDNVSVIKTDFDGTQKVGGKFCFVHIDTDLYEPTLRALEVFYPKMVKGGVIVVHDYTHIACAGPQVACVQFFSDKPEAVEKNDSQGIYTKQ